MTNLQSERNARELSLQREGGEPTRNHDGEGRDIAMIALQAALDKKALEPMLLDVRELCSYTDFILILSARSDRQVGAISDAIASTLKTDGHRPLGQEGLASGLWSLLDYGDAIVHVFHHPTREHYDIEGLWSDAPRVELDIPAGARIQPDDQY